MAKAPGCVARLLAAVALSPCITSSGLRVGNQTSDIDVVLVTHHDDAEVALGYAVPSIFRNVERVRHIFAVCTPEMCGMIESRLRAGELPASRLFIVRQEEFEFNYTGVKDARQDETRPKDWNAWHYQQLLKLYAHRVLRRGAGARPALLPTALIADSDVVWLEPTGFVYAADAGAGSYPTCWYSVASDASGAFPNDAEHGDDAVPTLLVQAGQAAAKNGTLEAACQELQVRSLRGIPMPPPKWAFTEAVPDGGVHGESFTAITHHSVFQADVVDALLDAVAKRCGKEAWRCLATAKPFLSEYDLYLSFARSAFPARVALRALPYMNVGRFGLHKVLASSGTAGSGARKVLLYAGGPPPVYAASHDDFPADSRCCVNTALGSCPACSDREAGAMAGQLQVCQTCFFPSPGAGGRAANRSHSLAANHSHILASFAACAHGELGTVRVVAKGQGP